MAGLLRTVAERLHVLEPARAMAAAGRHARHRLVWAARRGFGRHDSALVERYLAAHAERRLYLGAGRHEIDGWLNSDRYPPSPTSLHLDATQRFPLPDDSFRYVLSNHMIEHLPYASGAFMLGECLRVLEPGGTLRVSTPDFAFLVEIYRQPDTPIVARYLDYHLEWINRDDPATAPVRDALFVVNNFVRDWGHQFIYDRRILRHALEDAGFANIVECALNDSEHAPLRNVSHDERAPAGLVDIETITFEATKPLAGQGRTEPGQPQ